MAQFPGREDQVQAPSAAPLPVLCAAAHLADLFTVGASAARLVEVRWVVQEREGQGSIVLQP